MVSLFSSQSLLLAVLQRLEMFHVVSQAQLNDLNFADSDDILLPSKRDSESNVALLGVERPRLEASANLSWKVRHPAISLELSGCINRNRASFLRLDATTVRHRT